MARLRIRYNPCRPDLFLTDTPRPDCPDCRGAGGRFRSCSEASTGLHEDNGWHWCPCWNPQRAWLLLPLPRIPLRRRSNGEAPF